MFIKLANNKIYLTCFILKLNNLRLIIFLIFRFKLIVFIKLMAKIIIFLNRCDQSL